MAPRTAFAIAPTCGRSSGGRAPIPRRTPVRRPFLPRMSSSSASSAATSGGGRDRGQRLPLERLEIAGQVGEVHGLPWLGLQGIGA